MSTVRNENHPSLLHTLTGSQLHIATQTPNSTKTICCWIVVGFRFSRICCTALSPLIFYGCVVQLAVEQAVCSKSITSCTTSTQNVTRLPKIERLRIRGYFQRYALYKSTFYLLTFIYLQEIHNVLAYSLLHDLLSDESRTNKSLTCGASQYAMYTFHHSLECIMRQ